MSACVICKFLLACFLVCLLASLHACLLTCVISCMLACGLARILAFMLVSKLTDLWWYGSGDHFDLKLEINNAAAFNALLKCQKTMIVTRICLAVDPHLGTITL